MAIWDFVKDAGKSVFGSAEAAAPPAPAAGKDKAAADKPAHDAATQRKVDAMKAELRALNLDSSDVHLTLRGDTVRLEARDADRETMEKLILALGNIEGIAKVDADLPDQDAAARAQPVFHAVKRGETLSGIARHYLGDANRYDEIFQANRPMLNDPDRIYPGQMLRIPQAAGT